jgi:hypothetical protein
VTEETTTRTDGGRVLADPSALATAALFREVAHLKELFNTQIAGVNTRMDAIEKANEVFQDGLTRVPTQVQQEIGHLKELNDEQFRGIDRRFEERDARLEQTARGADTKVEAALAAARQTADKTEAGLVKQIDSIGTIVNTSITALNEKVDDNKVRLTTIEGRGSGFASSWVIALGALGGIGTIAGLIALIVALTGGGG